MAPARLPVASSLAQTAPSCRESALVLALRRSFQASVSKGFPPLGCLGQLAPVLVHHGQSAQRLWGIGLLP